MITEPRDQKPAPAAGEASDGIGRLTAAGLKALLEAGAGPPPALIDVRERWEFDTGHLPDAVNIPTSEFPQRLKELPRSGTAVFICRSGGRSLRACAMALRAGAARPVNLEGGMLAWAADVDPTMPVA